MRERPSALGNSYAQDSDSTGAVIICANKIRSKTLYPVCLSLNSNILTTVVMFISWNQIEDHRITANNLVPGVKRNNSWFWFIKGIYRVLSPHDARKAMKRQGVHCLGASQDECANVPVLVELDNRSVVESEGSCSRQLITHHAQLNSPLNSPLKHRTMIRRINRRTYSFDSGVRLDGACLPLAMPSTTTTTTLDGHSRRCKRIARATTGMSYTSQCPEFSSLIKELRKRALQCSFLKAVAMVVISMLVSWSYLHDGMSVPLWAPVDIQKTHTANATLAMHWHGRSLDVMTLSKGYRFVFPTKRRIHKSNIKSTMFHLPTSLDEENQMEAIRRDFGELEIHIPEEESMRLQRRTIYRDFNEDERYEDLQPEDDDSIDNYYAFDDDYNRNPLMKIPRFTKPSIVDALNGIVICPLIATSCTNLTWKLECEPETCPF
jgi:hypothetical protein